MTDLGQVFTEEKVAEFMVSLILKNITSSSRILDPCIGKNIFLSKISKLPHKELVGVEVDKSLVDTTISKFYNKENNRLIISNFFDFDENNFDFVIMNPPYVRQELLNSGMNSKIKIKESLPSEYNLFSKKSNLYVYFLVKALKHLSNNGELVAITYDSWLYTDFGEKFKKYLLDNFNIKSIVHFRHGAFKNINVGATILHIQKKQQDTTISYIRLNDPNEINLIFLKCYDKLTESNLINFQDSYNNYLNFDSDLFVPIDNISDKPINRGMNAKVNKYFLFNDDQFPQYTKKIIKNVSKVKTFSGLNYYDYILAIDKEVDPKLDVYLSNVKESINDSVGNVSMKSLIQKKEDWFIIPKKDSGSIIFNYYLRNNIHFLLNPSGYFVADNFYNIYVTENLSETLAILNSTFTTYSVLKNSKSQGRGLFKIQLNKFKTLPIIDINKLSDESKSELKNLGEKLINTKREYSDEIIKKIDLVLLKEINKKNPKINLVELKNKLIDIKMGLEE